MSNLTAIVAVAENGVIGNKGSIPWNVPADLQHFRDTTLNHTIIMGRKTFDCVGELPGRRSIVVTRNKGRLKPHTPSDVVICESIENVLVKVEGIDAFVIGGSEIYRALFPHISRLVVSEIPDTPIGDSYFPSIDPREWKEVSREQREGFVLATFERL